MSDSTLHDAYAAGYDAQVAAYECYIADLLFGLCFEFVRPGQQLLDAGIGSGLAGVLFARAGLTVHGCDFSPAMLDICRAKNFAASLRQHDLQQVPWPYPTAAFDALVSCGVLHFLPALEPVTGEAARLLRPGGLFAFTTKAAPDPSQPVQRQAAGDFDIYSHSPDHVDQVLQQAGFRRLKRQRAFVGEDIFYLWVAKKCDMSGMD